MPNTQTKPSQSRGTRSSSRNQTIKRRDNSSSVISKYFRRTSQDSDSSSSMSSHKENLDDSGSSDFKTPVAIKKVSKIAHLQTRKQAKKTKSKPRKKSPLRKFVEHNFKQSDVNEEHLQMALALSQSTYEAENPDAYLEPDSCLYPSTQEKVASFKKALEKFGLRCGKDKPEDRISLRKPQQKLPKKSRYRFITPILQMRTAEERDSIISSKVSLILAQNNTYNPPPDRSNQTSEVSSEEVRKYVSKTSTFALNNIPPSDQKSFYTESLKLSPCKSKCGLFFKKWENIPGRDKSPVRDSSLIMESSIDIPDDNKRKRSISPDLFASEDEYELNKSICRRETSDNIILNYSADINPHMDILEKEKTDENLNLSDNKGDQSNSLVHTQEKTVSEDERTVIYYNEDKMETSKISNSSGDVNVDDSINISAESKYSNSCRRENLNSDDSSRGENKETKSSSSDLALYPIGIEQGESYRSLEAATTDWYSNYEPQNDYHCNYSYTENRISSEQSINKSNEDSLNSSQESSQEIVIISDEELNYSSRHCTPRRPKNNRSDELEDSLLTKSLLKQLDEQIPQYNPIRTNINSLEQSTPTNRFTTKTENEKQESSDLPLDPSDIHREDNYKALEAATTDWYSDYEPPYELHDCHFNFSYGEKGINIEGITPLHQSSKKIHKNSSNKESLISSQESSQEVVIIDEELNYSSIHCTPKINTKVPEFEDSLLTRSILHQIEEQIPKSSPVRVNINPITPKNGMIMKTDNITPMPNYQNMDTPKIVKELEHFGLKPLKRQRGAKLLKYIYDSTHPLVEEESEESESDNIPKKRKETHQFPNECSIEIVGDLINDEELDKLIFQTSKSKKLLSCQIPLQIVWHNFVSANPNLKRNILLYEPLQLEVIHSMLKEQGFKFNIQDLLSFLDRKCITIRTCQGQGSSRKRK